MFSPSLVAMNVSVQQWCFAFTGSVKKILNSMTPL